MKSNESFTLAELEVLDTVIRRGSFTAAGKALGRATSAVSYQVKRLEAAIGAKVLERGARKVSLTPAGVLVAEAAVEVLERARRLERLAKELSSEWEPAFSIVVDGVLPLPPLMRALKRFGEAGVPTRVQLGVEYLSGVTQRFEREKAELMLVVEHAGDPRLEATPLPDVEMLLVAHPSHPLAAKRTLSRQELAKHVELVVQDSGTKGPSGPGRLSVGSAQRFGLSDFHGKREALASGVGFGFLPRHLAEPALARKELVVLRFAEGARQSLKAHLVRRRDAPLGRGARLFVGYLEKELAESRAPRTARTSRGPRRR